MKNYKVTILSVLLFGLISNVFSATVSEDFTGFNATTGTSYYTGNISGWYITGVNGLSDATKARSGTECLKFDNSPASGHYAISPVKSGGVGTVEFWYRHWDGDTRLLSFEVQTSSDSLTWTTISTITGFNSTTYTQFSQVVNNSAHSYVRILKTGGSERLLVDDFSVTDASACAGYIRDTTQDTICMGASLVFGTQTLTMSGNYYDTSQNAAGCDSIATLELYVTPVIRDTAKDTICMGASLVFGTQTLTMSGNYSDTSQNAAGCDSIATLELYVTPVIRDTAKDTICMGASLVFGTQTLTMSGNYSDTSQNAAGCDSIATLELYVTPVIRDTAKDTICMGASLVFGTQTLTMSGNYYDTSQNAAGCDSIATLELYVTPVIRDTAKDTICMGASLVFGTQTLTMSGNYSDTSQNAAGCDSIATLELYVTPVIRDTAKDTICMGASLVFGTQTLTMSGNYSDTSQNAAGCDSIATLELYVTPVIRDTAKDTICMGASLVFGTQTLTMSGNYSDTSQNSAGCDSITVMELLVNDFIRDTLADTICQGASVVFGTQTLTMSGNYSDTSQNAAGCDSITVMELLVNDFIRDTLADTICQGASVVFGTQTLTMSGNYSDTSQNAAGCDSITVMELLVNDFIRDTLADTICMGASVVFGTQTLTMSGNYSDTSQNAAGCDSITVMELLVNDFIRDTLADTICQGASVVFGTQTLTMSGNYSDTSQNAAGCDSITVMELLVNDFIRDTLADTICQGASLVFGTQTLTMSGNYSDTSQNAAGCDSITVMELLVNDFIRDTLADTICQGASVVFGTQTLTMSGNYSDTSQNAAGCDSITVMELLVNDFIRDTLADTICQGASVVFGTQTLTMSGNYSDTSQNAAGCDSITVMELLVNDFIRDTLADTICQGASLVFGTQTLTMSGNYSDTSQNAAGCDSITIMELLVNTVPRDTIIDTICSGDNIMYFGNTYSIAGLYSDTLQTALGCDSITVLDLRITLITRTDNIVLCNGLSYRVGPSLYTTAGTYTDVFTSASGCDSTIITNLSYYPQAIGNMAYNFCIGDSIQVLGNWYFMDSIVRDTITAGSATGCDSITIHTITTRTVTPALNLGVDVVSCVTGGVTIFASNAYDTYNWSNGGTTNVLSVSGAMSGIGSTDYILNVTQASSGCSATDTINVTFLSCVGLDENEADLTVGLYPNPATNFVTIDIYNKYNSENMKLEIMNSLGQVVTQKSVQGQSEKVILDVTNFSKGLYFVRISSDRMNMTKKLLIQK